MEVIKGSISGIPIRIEQGSITAKICDAYIVPQFPTDVSEMGVGGAIINAGAERGMRSYIDILKKRGGRLDYGEAHISASGGGNSKNLIHVASAYTGGRINSFSTVQKSIYNALILAQESGINTVAAPALGTGLLGGLSVPQCAKAMMLAIHQFALDGGKLGEFTFMIYGPKEACDVFATIMCDKSFENYLPEKDQKPFNFSAWARKRRKSDDPGNSHQRS